MFEKSLYDLIRGLRNHKGHERQYIQDMLRECRREIKSQDMNMKATALLKLTYLEMFGHDMSWASFNVLEVMSSQNFEQKKVGYLAAVQSFRPATEVLMLAENLLKKDLTSQVPVVIALPLASIPHVINASMANSLLSDLLPRLTHSHAAIRKKTIVTLYRLALVYPETLRPAWPKIKERLQDEQEDPSVTSAIVNVVCELGWRRPQDFLPLAPRLFDLLVESKNNWMAIKIIKLFATLTPLEPRLIKKLLPPLTSLIKQTPAMSLLYECIHGIVQGGILDSIEGTTEGDELAKLCVGKLRSMLVVEGDPNLKYVALLAFQKIVTSHPDLVSLHQDAILLCMDNADVSIRLRALELAVGMVNTDNLMLIVDRLLTQLLSAPFESGIDEATHDRAVSEGIVPRADSDDDEPGGNLPKHGTKFDGPVALPEDYRIKAIRSILSMCSCDTYANVQDFEWYIEILVKLVKACPSVSSSMTDEKHSSSTESSVDISCAIGEELRNVAVRVKSLRLDASLAAQLLLMVDTRPEYFPPSGNGGLGVLGPCAWIAGEYAEHLTNAEGVLDSLLHSSNTNLPAFTLSIFIHAALKVFAAICIRMDFSWTTQSRLGLSLLMARIIYFLEPLTSHPALDVQERSVEYLELMRLASEAANPPTSGGFDATSPPLLLIQAVPNLFIGMDLNPVAPGALAKVPDPIDFDLDTPINSKLHAILADAEEVVVSEITNDTFENFYHQPVELTPAPRSAAERLNFLAPQEGESYQQVSASDQLDAAMLARQRKDRQERNKDDPFYIGSSDGSNQLQNIIKTTNDNDIDIDSIPIMDLDIGNSSGTRNPMGPESQQRQDRLHKLSTRKRVEIAADENIDTTESGASLDSSRADSRTKSSRGKQSLLLVDSSALGSLSLEDGDTVRGKLDIEQREEEERALKEIERLRLEMQRASERIQAREESVVVRRKKKKKATTTALSTEEGLQVESAGGAVVAKKEKKKKKDGEGDGEVVAKRRKKKIVDIEESNDGPP